MSNEEELFFSGSESVNEGEEEEEEEDEEDFDLANLPGFGELEKEMLERRKIFAEAEARRREELRTQHTIRMKAEQEVRQEEMKKILQRRASEKSLQEEQKQKAVAEASERLSQLQFSFAWKDNSTTDA
eukprot:m.241120 g.241120  ORF g.241120 m.241120 type:complete len:129 (-) comp22524_c1_seq1:98-484(-)